MLWFALEQPLSCLIGLGALKCILLGLNMGAREAFCIGLVQDLSEPDLLIGDAPALDSRFPPAASKPFLQLNAYSQGN